MQDRLVRFSDGLPAIPESLLIARDRGQVLFVAGAGASRPAPSNLPDFPELVIDVYRKEDSKMVPALEAIHGQKVKDWRGLVDDHTHEQQAEMSRFAAGDYDVVFGMLERRLDRDPHKASRVRARVAELLSVATEPNSLHRSLVKLAQREQRTLIVTTNFDRLLELAARRQRLPVSSFALGAMPQPSRRPEFSGVLHIHGMLDSGKQAGSDLVLTDRDFGEAYLRRRGTAEFVYDAARIFHLVLVGYSANDPPMRYLLNAIAGDEVRFPDLKPRYAFVSTAAPDGVLEADWKGRGITPIPYSDSNGHAELRELLESWAHSTPKPGKDEERGKRLLKITNIDREKASEADRSVFDYFIRRSTPTEREDIAGLIGPQGAHLSWLNAINAIIREPLDTTSGR